MIAISAIAAVVADEDRRSHAVHEPVASVGSEV